MRTIGFVGFGLVPEESEPQDVVSDQSFKMIEEVMNQCPSERAAIFICEDSYHALKAANRLRVLFEGTHTFTARRSLVYGTKK